MIIFKLLPCRKAQIKSIYYKNLNEKLLKNKMKIFYKYFSKQHYEKRIYNNVGFNVFF